MYISTVCIGLFDFERMRVKITKTEQLGGSVYVTIDLDGGDVSRVRLVTAERDCHMATFDFIKNIP